MNDESTRVLKELADLAQPHQDRLVAAYAEKIGPDAISMEGFLEYMELVAEVDAFLITLLPRIASVTPNSIPSLQQVFCRKTDSCECIFGTTRPADFLRCVAKYRSFNEQHWRSQGWGGYGRDDHGEIANGNT